MGWSVEGGERGVGIGVGVGVEEIVEWGGLCGAKKGRSRNVQLKRTNRRS